VSAVLVLSLFGLSACGGSSTSSDSSTAPDTSTPAQASKFTILPQVLATEQYGVGFKKGNTQLRDAVEVTLVSMYNDGTIKSIAANYTTATASSPAISYDQYVLKSTKDKMPASVNLSNNTLRVGFDDQFAPYGYLDPSTGAYKGFDLDLAREVCKRMGWTFQAVPITWSAKDAELNGGDIDCIWNGFTMQGREDAYTWTDPYMNNKQVIVVLSSSGITDYAGLAGKTIMSQSGSSAQTDVESNAQFKAEGVQFSAEADYNTIFMELEQGTIDAVAVDYPTAIFQISSRS
jgi:polar amino acid transport system substrate-binding protein